MPIKRSFKYIMKSAKTTLKALNNFLVHRVLSLDDTPHRIALGMAIGMFVTWTPTSGIQMALTVALCVLFRANKFVGIPLAWISNPFTFVPIVYPNYVVGCWVLGKPANAWNDIKNAFYFSGGWWEQTVHWFSSIMHIFWELCIGSIIIGGALGIITYFVIYWMVVQYRKQKHQWHLKHGHHKAVEEVATQAVIKNDESGTKAVSQESAAQPVQQITPPGAV